MGTFAAYAREKKGKICISYAHLFIESFLALWHREETSPVATALVGARSMARALPMRTSQDRMPDATYSPWLTVALTPTTHSFSSSSSNASTWTESTSSLVKSSVRMGEL